MMKRKRKRNKYGSHEVVRDGRKFQSTLEGDRWMFLQKKQKEGLISDLEMQKTFILIPTQYKEVRKQLKTKVKIVKRVAERDCRYIADFVYKKGDQVIVEDTKSDATVKKESYIIKRKILLYLHGIAIRQVKDAREDV